MRAVSTLSRAWDAFEESYDTLRGLDLDEGAYRDALAAAGPG